MEEERPTQPPEPVHVPASQVTVKTVVIVCAVAAAAAGIVWLLIHSLVTITLFIAAALIAVALNHPIEWLQRHGFKRWPAIGTVLLAALLVIAGIFVLIIPAAVSQIEELIQGAPAFLERMQHTPQFRWLAQNADIQRRIQQYTGPNAHVLQSAVNPLLHALSGIVGGVVAIVTIGFLIVFMLGYGGRLIRGLLAETLPARRELYERMLEKLYRTIGGYLSGLAVIASLNATLATIVLAILRVPFFLPLGILSGLGSLVPLVGMTVAGAVITVVTLVTRGGWAGIAIACYILLYQQFENHVVAPVVYRRTVQLNPLLTLLGLVALAEIAGIVGAFLAVPTVAVAQIVLRELLVLRRERLGLPLKGPVDQRAQRPRFWRKARAS